MRKTTHEIKKWHHRQYCYSKVFYQMYVCVCVCVCVHWWVYGAPCEAFQLHGGFPMRNMCVC